MPQKDRFHELVRRLLERAGWTITHDPLYLKLGLRKAFVDLGAETALTAELGTRKIAVEVKSFLSAALMSELEKAIGQFVIYRALLGESEPDREMFVALPKNAYELLLDHEDGRAVIAACDLRLIIYDDETEEITQWIE
jgi:hypothetical protein